VIATVKCGACENAAHVKVNKNGCAYYFCQREVDGEPCNHQQRWGKHYSRKMIAAYEADQAAPEAPPASQPKPEMEAQRDGFFY